MARYSRQGLLSLVSEVGNNFILNSLADLEIQILLPVPQVPPNNIVITYGDIFGATFPAGLPPVRTVDLNLDRLRTFLAENIIAAGFFV